VTPWTLLVVNALECVLAALYLAIAGHYARRGHVSKDWGPTLFALFWGGIGLYALIEALWSLGIGTMGLPLAYGVTALQLKVLLVGIAFFGLVSYLLRLYTGHDLRLVVGGYYLAVFALLLWDYLRMEPIGQEVQPWRGGLLYAHPPTALGGVLPLFLVVPALVAAVGFGLLVRVTKDPAARHRIARLSVALIVFFAGLALGNFFTGWFWWPLVEKALGLVAVLGALDALGTASETRRHRNVMT
jgi:hypothetical protein